ncbi:MAG: hypothetical protein AAFX99_10275, partial [Myxococcota bacterium]
SMKTTSHTRAVRILIVGCLIAMSGTAWAQGARLSTPGGPDEVSDQVDLDPIEDGITCASDGVNLVQNGSFEEPVTSGNWNVYEAVPGWDITWVLGDEACEPGSPVTGPALEIQTDALNLAPVPDGRQYAELDADCQGPGGRGGGVERPTVEISQTMATVPGNRYAVSFMFQRRANARGSQVLTVSWDGQVVFSEEAPESWEQRTVEVTARGFASLLSLADTGEANSLGVFLDDVQVVGVDSDCGCPQRATVFTMTNAFSDEAHAGNSDHGIWAPQLFCDQTAEFTFMEGSASLMVFPDGTARMTGEAIVTEGGCDHMGESWQVDVYLDADQAGTVAPKRELRSGTQPAAVTDAWAYYIMREGAAVLSNPETGDMAALTHRPANRAYGFQVGETANGKNLNFGASGWFAYTAQIDGELRTGVGDFNVDLADVCDPGTCANPIEQELIVLSDNNAFLAGAANDGCSALYGVSMDEATGEAVLNQLPVYGTSCIGGLPVDRPHIALSAQEGRVYVIDADDTELGYYDLATTTYTAIPCEGDRCLPSNAKVHQLEVMPNGELMTINDRTGEVYLIDPATAAARSVGPIADQADQEVRVAGGDMALGRDGTLYMFTNKRGRRGSDAKRGLYTLDVQEGDSFVDANYIGNTRGRVSGMAVRANGDLIVSLRRKRGARIAVINTADASRAQVYHVTLDGAPFAHTGGDMTAATLTSCAD